MRANDLPDINRRGALAMTGFNPRTPVEMAIEYEELDFDDAITAHSVGVKYYDVSTVYDGESPDYIVTQQDNGGYVHLLRSYVQDNIPGMTVSDTLLACGHMNTLMHVII